MIQKARGLTDPLFQSSNYPDVRPQYCLKSRADTGADK
jgi:hypothetical protein